MCFEVEKLQGNSPVRALVRKTVQAIAPKPTGLAREILEIDGSLHDDATAAMNLAYWIVKPAPATHYRKARLKAGEIVFIAPFRRMTVENTHFTVKNSVCRILLPRVLPPSAIIWVAGLGTAT